LHGPASRPGESIADEENLIQQRRNRGLRLRPSRREVDPAGAVPPGVLGPMNTPISALIGPAYVLMPKYGPAVTVEKFPHGLPSGVALWQPL
jgi:hypothetical protein